MRRQAQVPRVAAEYFKRFGVDEHPVITQVFRPGIGWTRHATKKRVSRSWIRNHLQPEGVTRVQLSAGGHLPDFAVKELLKY